MDSSRCLSTILSLLLILGAISSPASSQGLSASDVDFDDSGIVNFGDFVLFAAAFGQAEPVYDLNGDGSVDFADFLAFVPLYGTQIVTADPTDTDVLITSPSGFDHTMALVPGGTFLMGSDSTSNQAPMRSVHVDSFLIDIHEVTNSQFAAFLNEEGTEDTSAIPYLNLEGRVLQIVDEGGQFAPRRSRDIDTPVVHVTWVGARAYCEWTGRRLPTEAEWEKAARGTDGRIYPWGNDPPDASLLNYNKNVREPLPVGSYPKGVSPYGVYDMAGNVFEWVADYYAADYYATAPDSNPTGPETGEFRVIRGGAHAAIVDKWVQTTYRQPSRETQGLVDTGFRCAKDHLP